MVILVFLSEMFTVQLLGLGVAPRIWQGLAAFEVKKAFDDMIGQEAKRDAWAEDCMTSLDSTFLGFKVERSNLYARTVTCLQMLNGLYSD